MRDKNRKQWATFAELNVPIVKTLEGNVALRYDHYSDFGSTTNPKFSLRWQPTREVLVRGSYGTGFLAPSLYSICPERTTCATTPRTPTGRTRAPSEWRSAPSSPV